MGFNSHLCWLLRKLYQHNHNTPIVTTKLWAKTLVHEFTPPLMRSTIEQYLFCLIYIPACG